MKVSPNAGPRTLAVWGRGLKLEKHGGKLKAQRCQGRKLKQARLSEYSQPEHRMRSNAEMSLFQGGYAGPAKRVHFDLREAIYARFRGGLLEDSESGHESHMLRVSSVLLRLTTSMIRW